MVITLPLDASEGTIISTEDLLALRYDADKRSAMARKQVIIIPFL